MTVLKMNGVMNYFRFHLEQFKNLMLRVIRGGYQIILICGEDQFDVEEGTNWGDIARGRKINTYNLCSRQHHSSYKERGYF